MKSKKLIILISVVVVLITVVVILATVFSVKVVQPRYHNFISGEEVIPSGEKPTADEILELCRGKSMFFMSKEKLMTDLNKRFTDWHAFEIVKNFPNIVDVHFVKRTVAAKIDIGGNIVYLDTYGYVMNVPAETDYVDISSGFEHRDSSVCKPGEKLKLLDETGNARLAVILEAINAGFTCYINYDDVTVVLGSNDVFEFDTNNNLVINMPSGAKIKVEEPSFDLTSRLQHAYSVYYNESKNLQQAGVVITVKSNGTITTPNPDK